MMLTTKPIANSYWRHVFLLASGNGLAQIVGIAGIPILTRLYSPEVFALQSIFVQVVAFLAALVMLRFEYLVPLLRTKYEFLALAKWAWKIGPLMVLVFSLLIFIVDMYGISGYLKLDSIFFLYFAPITAFFISLSLMYQFEAQRLNDFGGSAKSEVVSKIFYVASGVVFFAVMPVLGLLLTTLFGAIGRILSLKSYFLDLIRHGKTSGKIDNLLIDYRTRSIGLVVSNTILTASSLLPLIFISSQYGSNVAGQFALVLATVFLPSGLLGAAIGNVFYQRAAALWNDGELKLLKSLWRETLVKLVIIALPVYGIIYFMAELIYPLVFGQQWQQAGEFAKILTLSAFFSFISGPLDRLSLVLGFGRYLPFIHLLRLVLISLVVYFISNGNYGEYVFVICFSWAMSALYITDVFLCGVLLSLKLRAES